jgi:opacity protein-like surface antigen
MKNLLLAVLAVALSLSIVAFAQSNSNPSSNQQQGQQGAQNSQTSAGNQHMSGTVSKNGTTFTDRSDNKTYNVSNPDALAGHEGQPVALLVHVDPDDNVIHIIQVEAMPQ